MVYLTKIHKDMDLFTDRVAKRLKDTLQYKEKALKLLEKNIHTDNEHTIKKALWHLYKLGYFQEDLYKTYLIHKGRDSLEKTRHSLEHIRRLQDRSKDHFPFFLKHAINRHYIDMEICIKKIMRAIDDLTREDSLLFYIVSGQKSLVGYFDHIERHKDSETGKSSFTSGSIHFQELHNFLHDYKRYFDLEKREAKKVSKQIKKIQKACNKEIATFQKSQRRFLRQLVKYRRTHIQQIRELTHLISDYAYALLDLRYALGALGCCLASVSFAKHLFRDRSHENTYSFIFSSCDDYLPAFPQLQEGYNNILKKHKAASDHALDALFSLSSSHWTALPSEA